MPAGGSNMRLGKLWVKTGGVAGVVAKGSHPEGQEAVVKNWALAAVVEIGRAGLSQNTGRGALGTLPLAEVAACSVSAPRTVPV